MDDFLTDEQMVGGKPQADDDLLTDEDMVGGTALPSSSGAGAAARGAAEGLFPTVGGLGVGLGAGALATAATGNPLVGLGAGLATGLGAGELLNRGQDWVMEKLGMREGEGNFSRAQQLADEVEHPYLKTAGASLPAALLLKPTGAMLQRGVGAAIGGGVSAADELIREGHIDPGKVAIGAATGFALPTANRAGAAIEGVGARAGARVAPYVPESLKRSPQAPVATPEPAPLADDITMGSESPGGRPGDAWGPSSQYPSAEARNAAFADWDAQQARGTTKLAQPRLEAPVMEGEVLPPDVGGLGLDARTREWEHNVSNAEYQLSNAAPELKGFWEQALIHAQDNLAKWRRYGTGKGDHTHDADASLGPAGDEHPFTYADSDRANDLTTTSFGTAQEQPRAARLIEAGNPVGAQMAAREAAHTSSLLRNYAKDRTALESVAKIDIDRPESPIAEDIQAALKALEPRGPQRAITDQSKPLEGEVIQPRRNPEDAGGIWPDGLGEGQPDIDVGGPPRKGPAADEFADFNIDQGAAKRLDERLSDNRFDARADYGEQEAQKARREAQEEAGREPYVLDLDRSEYTNTTGQRALARPPEAGRRGPVIRDTLARASKAFEGVSLGSGRSSPPERLNYESAGAVRQKDPAAHAERLRNAPPIEPGLPPVSIHDLPPGRFDDINLKRGDVTGAVTPRPTLKINAQPRSAKDLKFSRGTREVVPEKYVPADTPIDKYAPVDAPKGKAEAVFSPKEEVNLLQKLADIPREAENARTGQYRNEAQVGEKKVQLGRGPVGERRQKALTAFTEAAQDMIKHGVPKFNLDPSKENVANILDHATKLFEASKSRFGGKDPTERGVGYTPNEKPKEFNLVAAARNFVKNPTPATMKPYVEALALEGNTGKKEYTGKDSHKVEFTDALEADLKPSENREEITPRKLTGDESFDRAQRELETWADNLTNDQWAAMDAHHDGDLAMTIKTTQNPELVLKQFRNDLANLRVRPGRSIDAEHVAEEAAPEAPKMTPEDELAKLIGEQETGEPAEKKAADPKYKGVKDVLHDFLFEDLGEAGFLDFSAIGRDLKALANRLMSSTARVRGAPAAPPAPAHVQAAVQSFKEAAREYSKEVIQPWFTRLNSRVSGFKFQARAEVEAAVADKAALPTPAEFAEGFHAVEARKPMTAKMKAFWDQWSQPRYDALKADSQAYLNLARALQIPGWKELKDLKTNGPGFADYMPHVSGKEIQPHEEMDVVAQTLSGWNAHSQTRDLFTLQNLATGERLLYKVDPDDTSHITILRNGAPQKVQVVGSPDMAEIGTDIPLTVKGVKGTWRVDLSQVEEIRANAGRNPDGTPKVDFIDNPHMALLAASTSTKLTLERMRMLASLLTDQRFTKWVTKDEKTAKANGWLDQPKGENWVKHKSLPQFEDFYMPPAFDWALSDFVKRGFDVPDSVAVAKARLDHFAQTTAKIFFAFGAPVHGFNVFDKWVIGRGKDWFTASGWKGLGKFGEAMRSVTNQDATQHELGEHGMNMLYVHTMVKDMLPEAGRKLGMDMTKNAWRWDPFAKQFGITTPQMSRNLYKYASTAPLWWFTDVLATQRYLELKGQGLSPKDAVKKLQHSADDYVMQSTYIGKGGGGRIIQKLLADPSLSWFTAFHQHNFHMLGRMGSSLLNPKSTVAERADAAAQFALLGGMLALVYPALSAGYAELTGNKHSEFERRGISRIAGLGADIAKGKKGPEDILRNVWTPSSVADTAMRVSQNKTFSGKPIVSKGDFRDWRNVPRAAGQAGEFALQQFVSPYKTISTAAERPGATPGSVAGRFAESVLNLKTPTPQSVMHDAKAPIKLIQEARQRQNHPTGVLENAVNRATKRNYGG